MKRAFAAALLALLMLLVCAAAAEEAAPAATLAQSTCSIVRSGEYYLVYCFAQLHNPTDQVLCLDGGLLEVMSGEEAIAAQEIDRIWPYFLSPGEDGYLFDVVAFEPEEGASAPSVTGLRYDAEYMQISPEYAGIRLQCDARIERDGDGGMTVVCTVQNATGQDAFDPSVTFGLYMDSGNMLYADGATLTDVGVPDGGSTLVRFEVDDAFVSQWESYGAAPTQARAFASYREAID